MTSALRYRRILVKFSGEALSNEKLGNISLDVLNDIAMQLVKIQKAGAEVAVVIGGGNFLRGKQLSDVGLDRVVCDKMGMLATIMNALALADFLNHHNLHTIVMSALPISGVAAQVDQILAREMLSQKKIVIFAGGTGNPYFTTDTAASLRAIEINADLLCKATNVDGIYSTDPKQNLNAKLYDKLSYEDVLKHNLQVMDQTAFVMCAEENLPLVVYNISNKEALLSIIQGNFVGTYVGNN